LSARRHNVSVVNETTHAAVHAGRPRLELSSARRRALELLAFRIGRLTSDLEAARAELAGAARAARLEGASVRAIAEAVGLSRPRVHELLSNNVEPSCGCGSLNGGCKCA
jgi:hypothetical protein